MGQRWDSSSTAGAEPRRGRSRLGRTPEGLGGRGRPLVGAGARRSGHGAAFAVTFFVLPTQVVSSPLANLLIIVARLLAVAVTLGVGFRLVLLWRQTRKLPELYFGLGLIVGAFAGIFFLASRRIELPISALTVHKASVLTGGAVTVFLVLAVWQVFRPGRLWAAVFAWSIILLLVAHFIGYATNLIGPFDRPWRYAECIGPIIARAWFAFESFRYVLLLQRRQKLGLGDPVVSNRFWLWGWAGVLGTLNWIWYLLAWWLPFFRIDTGTQLKDTVYVLLYCALMWLAFYPPHRYIDFIERRHLEPEAA